MRESAKAGMRVLGQLSSARGIDIYAVHGVLNNQYESIVTIEDAVISFVLDKPGEFVSSRSGAPFREVQSLNFCARDTSFLARVNGAMTVASCVFSRSFLKNISEIEQGLELNNFGIISGINSPRIVGLCQLMFSESLAPGFASSVFADAVGTAIALEIARYNGGHRTGSQFVRGGLAPWQMQRLEDYIRANLSASLTLAELARLLGISVRHLTRGVKQTKGISISQWVAQQRFIEARRLLAQTALSISEIAIQSGFQSPAAFATAFRAAAGCTPSEYRRLCS